jgi:hypothetical protein
METCFPRPQTLLGTLGLRVAAPLAKAKVLFVVLGIVGVRRLSLTSREQVSALAIAGALPAASAVKGEGGRDKKPPP